MQIHVQSSFLQRIPVPSARDNRRRNSFKVQTLELCGQGRHPSARLNHLFHTGFNPHLSKPSVTYTTSERLSPVSSTQTFTLIKHLPSPPLSSRLIPSTFHFGHIYGKETDNSGRAPQQLTYDICGPDRASGICVQTPPLCTSKRLSRSAGIPFKAGLTTGACRG